MGNYELVVFFIVAWFAIFWLSIVAFRMDLKKHLSGIFRSIVIIVPVSWFLIQLMKQNEYFHILNAPIEVGLGTLVMVRLLKFHRVDAFMMITLSYGIVVTLENISSIISNHYQMSLASKALAQGIHPYEWIWVILLLIGIYILKVNHIGFTVVRKYQKPKTTKLFRCMLVLTFLMLWISNITVHFAGELLLVFTFLVFFSFGYVSIQLYRRELNDDF